MARFLASYDLTNKNPSPYGPFLEHAANNGWEPWVPFDGGKNRLPNTTLRGEFATLPLAVAAFEQSILDTSRDIGAIIVPKWIVAEYLTSTSKSDEKLQNR